MPDSLCMQSHTFLCFMLSAVLLFCSIQKENSSNENITDRLLNECMTTEVVHAEGSNAALQSAVCSLWFLLHLLPAVCSAVLCFLLSLVLQVCYLSLLFVNCLLPDAIFCVLHSVVPAASGDCFTGAVFVCDACSLCCQVSSACCLLLSLLSTTRCSQLPVAV